ncbi:MFS transporter [Pedococcus bigeumensis]|uniref:MFS transporter n=1 Tax=Pedococcus bigeumensis TaxID=433644 RepID=A0A502CMI7_9MICO|nr:MFS transporter [Pedococcus bigeumensis]TPG14043.1 MFS transporter [Pedococcus bigeumensis]
MSNPVEMRQPVETPGVGGLGRLLASTGVSIAGQGMVLAAVPLLAASLTRNPVGVSLTVAAGYAAWLAVGLPAGALVDRWPRRRTMVLADVARAMLLAGLAIAVALDVASLLMLVLVVFAIGVASCFFDPAAQAAIPQVVGREPGVLARANSRLWSLDLVGRSLIGPPLGAALFALATVLPFASNALTFVVSALLLAGLGGVDRAEGRSAAPAGVRAAMREGVRFLWRHRELRALTLGMASFNLTYNIAFAPLVLFAQDRLHLGDRGFGLLLAMIAIGGLLGAWLAPRIQRRLTSPRAYAFGLLVQGIAWGAMWMWPNRWLAGAALVLIGLSSMTVTVIGASARQSLTPDDLLGRVSAGTRTLGLGSAGVGALLGGLVGNAAGLGAPLLMSFACALAASAYFVSPRRLAQR